MMQDNKHYTLLDRQTTEDGYLLEKYNDIANEYTLELKRHSQSETIASSRYRQEKDADQIMVAALNTPIKQILNGEIE